MSTVTTKISYENSTNALNGDFVGDPVDVGGYSTVSVICKSSENATIKIYQSYDGILFDETDTTTCVVDVVMSKSYTIYMKYLRVNVENGDGYIMTKLHDSIVSSSSGSGATDAANKVVGADVATGDIGNTMLVKQHVTLADQPEEVYGIPNMDADGNLYTKDSSIRSVRIDNSDLGYPTIGCMPVAFLVSGTANTGMPTIDGSGNVNVTSTEMPIVNKTDNVLNVSDSGLATALTNGLPIVNKTDTSIKTTLDAALDGDYVRTALVGDTQPLLVSDGTNSGLPVGGYGDAGFKVFSIVDGKLSVSDADLLSKLTEGVTVLTGATTGSSLRVSNSIIEDAIIDGEVNVMRTTLTDANGTAITNLPVTDTTVETAVDAVAEKLETGVTVKNTSVTPLNVSNTILNDTIIQKSIDGEFNTIRTVLTSETGVPLTALPVNDSEVKTAVNAVTTKLGTGVTVQNIANSSLNVSDTILNNAIIQNTAGDTFNTMRTVLTSETGVALDTLPVTDTGVKTAVDEVKAKLGTGVTVQNEETTPLYVSNSAIKVNTGDGNFNTMRTVITDINGRVAILPVADSATLNAITALSNKFNSTNSKLDVADASTNALTNTVDGIPVDKYINTRLIDSAGNDILRDSGGINYMPIAGINGSTITPLPITDNGVSVSQRFNTNGSTPIAGTVNLIGGSDGTNTRIISVDNNGIVNTREQSVGAVDSTFATRVGMLRDSILTIPTINDDNGINVHLVNNSVAISNSDSVIESQPLTTAVPKLLVVGGYGDVSGSGTDVKALRIDSTTKGLKVFDVDRVTSSVNGEGSSASLMAKIRGADPISYKKLEATDTGELYTTSLAHYTKDTISASGDKGIVTYGINSNSNSYQPLAVDSDNYSGGISIFTAGSREYYFKPLESRFYTYLVNGGSIINGRSSLYTNNKLLDNGILFTTSTSNPNQIYLMSKDQLPVRDDSFSSISFDVNYNNNNSSSTSLCHIGIGNTCEDLVIRKAIDNSGSNNFSFIHNYGGSNAVYTFVLANLTTATTISGNTLSVFLSLGGNDLLNLVEISALVDSSLTTADSFIANLISTINLNKNYTASVIYRGSDTYQLTIVNNLCLTSTGDTYLAIYKTLIPEVSTIYEGYTVQAGRSCSSSMSLLSIPMSFINSYNFKIIIQNKTNVIIQHLKDNVYINIYKTTLEYPIQNSRLGFKAYVTKTDTNSGLAMVISNINMKTSFTPNLLSFAPYTFSGGIPVAFTMSQSCRLYSVLYNSYYTYTKDLSNNNGITDNVFNTRKIIITGVTIDMAVTEKINILFYKSKLGGLDKSVSRFTGTSSMDIENALVYYPDAGTISYTSLDTSKVIWNYNSFHQINVASTKTIDLSKYNYCLYPGEAIYVLLNATHADGSASTYVGVNIHTVTES